MKIKQTVKKILGSELSHKIGMELRFHQNPKLRGLIGNNIEFKNKHKGKRCFIFGNGPSLKNVDFSLFENEYTITVNQLPKNSNFGQLKTTYHVWADENFSTCAVEFFNNKRNFRRTDLKVDSQKL